MTNNIGEDYEREKNNLPGLRCRDDTIRKKRTRDHILLPFLQL